MVSPMLVVAIAVEIHCGLFANIRLTISCQYKTETNVCFNNLYLIVWNLIAC